MKTARCYPVNKWAKNIKECYQSATEKDKADGGAWYDNVRARCEKWAAEFGRNVETVAGEVDITPPRITSDNMDALPPEPGAEVFGDGTFLILRRKNNR